MSRTPTRRGLLAAAVLAPHLARAADEPWPSRPIRVLMPFGAGGSMDVLSRLLAPAVSATLGQSVLVENRTGATGTVAMGALLALPADGHSIMFTGSSISTVWMLLRGLPFGLDAFAPLSLLTIGPTIICVPEKLGVRSLAEFVAAAKARPGQWSFGSSGIGTSVHLGGELLKMAAGLDMTHVPYRSTPQIITDLLEGRIQMSVLGETDARAFLQAGQLRGLAACHPERLPGFPDLPTCAELGYPGVRASNNFGIMARAGTPAAIQARLGDAYRAAVRQPEVVRKLAEIGLIVVGSSAEEFGRGVREDMAHYREVIRVAEVRLD
jgi:tripartite-type tricarboxylate transporter receptor subunit TctC